MRIIFLNIWWNGKLFKEVKKYLLEQSNSTDVFCLNEVTPDKFIQLSKFLPDYNSRFAFNPKLENAINGQAIFVNKKYVLGVYKEILLYDSSNGIDVPGYMQTLEIKTKNISFKVGFLQGVAYPGDKNDNEARINQSEKILEQIGPATNMQILGGDFNLNPETKSIKMFEDAGYRNLIKEFNIKDTRGKINHKNFSEDDRQYFADYCFVSPDVKVKSFEVPNVEISDHLPLILDFSFDSAQD